MIWNLTKEEARKLRIELRKRIRVLAGLRYDVAYFLDTMSLKRATSGVKSLTHYQEVPLCHSRSIHPVLCLCQMKTGEIVLQRHAKGSCPYINY